MKILISDNLAPEARELIQATGKIQVDDRAGMGADELLEKISEYDGLIIRSATKVTEKVLQQARNLKVIGRAGIGLDNVDIPAATARGIVVMNTPEGNTVTTAEHTVSMLLALSRNIPQATASMKSLKWEKKKFQGKEVFRKTLGIVGMGKIGSIVADRAQGLKMKVIAYDPFLKEEAARNLGVELVSFDELLSRADYLTVHVPRTAETVGLINEKAIAKMKNGSIVINCARGGIVDEKALYKALSEGKLRGAGLDVFETEPPGDNPLLSLDNVICTPHLGASTEEAQRNVAIDVAQQMADYLLNGTVKNAVNMPSIEGEQMAVLKPFLELCEKMALFLSQIVSGGLEEVAVSYMGEVSGFDCRPLSTAVLVGLLSPRLKDMVNFVNAPVIAKERGIRVSEIKSETVEDFLNLISIEVKVDGKKVYLAGTLFGKKEPRIVRIDEFALEAAPKGHLVFIKSVDAPGVIGELGAYIGSQSININRMSVGQDLENRQNVILINTDVTVPGPVMEGLRELENVIEAVRVDI